MTERKREYKDRKQKKNSPKNQSKVTKFLKWFFIGVLLLGITAITIVGFYVLYIIPVYQYHFHRFSFSSRIFREFICLL